MREYFSVRLFGFSGNILVFYYLAGDGNLSWLVSIFLWNWSVRLKAVKSPRNTSLWFELTRIWPNSSTSGNGYTIFSTFYVSSVKFTHVLNRFFTTSGVYLLVCKSNLETTKQSLSASKWRVQRLSGIRHFISVGPFKLTLCILFFKISLLADGVSSLLIRPDDLNVCTVWQMTFSVLLRSCAIRSVEI